MNVTESDGYWLAGLTDGEGCFYFQVRPRKRQNCYSFDFVFKIALRADDLSTLLEAQRILGVPGSFYTCNKRTGKGKPLSAYRVQKKADIAHIIEFFGKFKLRSKKAHDFEIWRKAFDFYVGVIAEQPVQHVSFARFPRPSFVKRRPLVGTPKVKLRRTPEALVAKMREFQRQLREGRAYVQAVRCDNGMGY